MRTKSNTNYNIEPTHPSRNFQDFLQQHRIIAIFLIVGPVVLFTIIMILILRQPSDPEDSYRVPENAPHLSFEHEYLIEYPAQDTLGEEILFNLNLVLMNDNELTSAPTDNSGNRSYIASIDEDSYHVDNIHTIDNGELYTMNINVSDGRKYLLYLLIDNTYHDEYAVAVLDRLDKLDSQDYIITFTSNTSEYYDTLGTDNTDNSKNSSTIVDHITGTPLNPIPDSATNWLSTLNLSTPQTIYATLPSLR